jgi:uncharacterized protein YndB with AHSA1/START domain
MPDHPPTVHARVGEQSLSFVREFDAPAELVFRAHTDPELFVRWMGPRGTSVRLDEFEPVTGGRFRYSVVGASKEFAFFGSYHEVTSPHRIVHTWEFAGDPGRPTMESLTFVDMPGSRCRLDGSSLYGTAEQCAEMLAFDETGQGMDENFDRLDELLPELSPTT